jgi:hypothetical protein
VRASSRGAAARCALAAARPLDAQVPLVAAARQGELLPAVAARLPSSTADGEGAAEAGEKEDRSGANV